MKQNDILFLINALDVTLGESVAVLTTETLFVPSWVFGAEILGRVSVIVTVTGGVGTVELTMIGGPLLMRDSPVLASKYVNPP